MAIGQGAEYEINLLTGGVQNLEQVYERIKDMKSNELNDKQQLNELLSLRKFLSELEKRKDNGDILSRTLNRVIKDRSVAKELLKSERGVRLFEKILDNECNDLQYNVSFVKALKASTHDKQLGKKGNFFKKHLRDR